MRRRLHLAASLVIAACLSACGSSSDTPEESPEGSEDAIIGGVDADGPELDAIGTLTSSSGNGDCTATLIAPDVILTAKHCVVDHRSGTGALLPAQDYLFAIGPQSRVTMDEMVPIESIETCSLGTGGQLGLGCDVALCRLAKGQMRQRFPQIKPLAVAAKGLPESAVGKRFTAVGFGLQDQQGRSSGSRKRGLITLRALRGAPMQVLFPTLDAFRTAVGVAEGEQAARTRDLQSAYAQNLLTDRELFAGYVKDDIQVCSGDSGGPLLAKTKGKLTIFGVASAVGFAGNRVPCNFGSVYASLGPEAQELIKRHIK